MIISILILIFVLLFNLFYLFSHFLDLLKQASDMLTISTNKIGVTLIEIMNKFTRGTGSEILSGSLSKGFQSALTLATSYTSQSVSGASGSGSHSSSGGGGSSGSNGREGGSNEEEEGSADRNEEDPYGLASTLQAFNTVEICVRYTERLSTDITRAGEAVYNTVIPMTGKIMMK